MPLIDKILPGDSDFFTVEVTGGILLLELLWMERLLADTDGELELSFVLFDPGPAGLGPFDRFGIETGLRDSPGATDGWLALGFTSPPESNLEMILSLSMQIKSNIMLFYYFS